MSDYLTFRARTIFISSESYRQRRGYEQQSSPVREDDKRTLPSHVAVRIKAASQTLDKDVDGSA